MNIRLATVLEGLSPFLIRKDVNRNIGSWNGGKDQLTIWHKAMFFNNVIDKTFYAEHNYKYKLI